MSNPLQIMPLAHGIKLAVMKQEAGSIHLVMEMTRPFATCPVCGKVSNKIRSYYERTVRDLAWCGIPVVIRLTVRRFACTDRACQQRIFCERIPELVPVYGRRTVRFTETLSALGRTTSAEAATRLARNLGLSTSADTVLRSIRAAPEPKMSTPRVLGVDDWAWRKGQSYGTVLVDLETHKVVDLLPDRQASTLQQWLQDHPGVEIISRDRSQSYAKAAQMGAPNARQVADRWHLLKNLGDALERWFHRLRPKLSQAVSTVEPHNHAADNSSTEPTLGQHNRQVRFDEIQNLKKQGLSLRKIARILKLSRNTVRKYASAEQCPQAAQRTPSKTLLDNYIGHIQKRLADGCHNSRILFEEILSMGYQGSRPTVARWIRTQQSIDHKDDEQPKTHIKSIEPRKLQCWFLTRLHKLPLKIAKLLTKLLADIPELQRGYTLAHQFHTMVRCRAGHALPAWLNAVHKSGIPELKSFAVSLNKDYAAIFAGLTESWSQGPVEGINNRLKLIKRLMFGRAKFDLLRKRVLLAL
ncbi:ISL3 family transposase [Desulfotruncus alcoholivorax]|uniref:ISL3 family transposase n=3 Tax=Desulfotruncus alcoholivorax TaxID=265477 RepID=UPI00040F32DB|nr:ISL3 family transposase [Desulfotruncus alcoholivorax]